MIGKIIKYNSSRETGVIYSFTNRRTYQFRKINSLDGDVGYGYIVDFRVYYDENYDRKFARDISVIEDNNNISSDKKTISKHKKKQTKHKPCNADKYIYDDKKFNRFVKNFMSEQKNENE